MALRPDHVYVNPPNATLTIVGGRRPADAAAAVVAAVHADRPPDAVAGAGRRPPGDRRGPLGRRHRRGAGRQGDQGGRRDHLRPERGDGDPRQHAPQRHRLGLRRLRAGRRPRSAHELGPDRPPPLRPFARRVPGPRVGADGRGAGPAADLRAAAGRHRRRLLAVQAEHDPAPGPPPDDAPPLRADGRLRPGPAGAPRGAGGAVPGLPDPRHLVLPRPGGLRGAAAGDPPGDHPRAAPRRADPGLGRRLLDRRGGLLAGDRAGRGAGRAGRAGAGEDPGDRRQRAGPGGRPRRRLHREHRHGRLARAAPAVLHAGRGRLPDQQGRSATSASSRGTT